MTGIDIRSARMEDREAVLAFCEHTWEWGDYIDRVWDDWVQDSNGRLFVAVLEQEPVGLVHMRMVTAEDAWLEGLRVAEGQRKRGLAKQLTDSAVLEAMQRGAKYVRLVIDATNERSIQITERNFWRRVGSFVPYFGTPMPIASRSAERTQTATLEDLDEIIDYLNSSNIFPLIGGLYYAGFVARPITEGLLQARIAAGQLYLLRRWDRLDGLAIAEIREEREEKRLSVGYIDGTAIEAVSLIAYDLRCLLQALEVERVRIYTPDYVLMHDALDGIEYTWDGATFYTYERSLQ